MCDRASNTVHLLDQDGGFLPTILSSQQEIEYPRGVCVDDENNLYVGQNFTNTVSVYKYLQWQCDSVQVSTVKVYKYQQWLCTSIYSESVQVSTVTIYCFDKNKRLKFIILVPGILMNHVYCMITHSFKPSIK